MITMDERLEREDPTTGRGIQRQMVDNTQPPTAVNRPPQTKGQRRKECVTLIPTRPRTSGHGQSRGSTVPGAACGFSHR